MFCINCGATVEESSVFCTNCGKRIKADPVVTVEEQEAQTAELIRRLGRDCPTPAFIVPNPNCCYNYAVQPACNTCGGGF